MHVTEKKAQANITVDEEIEGREINLNKSHTFYVRYILTDLLAIANLQIQHEMSWTEMQISCTFSKKALTSAKYKIIRRE